MSRHLGMQVSAYVDGGLDARTMRAFDQHLVACQVCRHTAEQERRILTSLRTGVTPGLSQGFQSALLGLATPIPPKAGEGPGRWGPPIPPRPLAVRHPPRVPTVAPAAPALHRSPRRAAMMAGLAAGASAAAAIGLAVAGPGAAGPSGPSPQPAARIPGSANLAPSTAAFLTSRLSDTVAVRDDAERRGR